ncbi:alpha/beta hydrolase family protein [Roseixanthobacter pseudopolyaromaticivorans]|uniref:alpha/beta hydrolase family protein n=1 Tax=Xanthobacteraceae TaxID=335928 RepID=UPI003727A2EB
MGLRFRDELFDAQFLRTLGHTYYHGADIGECLALAARIPDGDTERWYSEWNALAERLYDAGQASLAAGRGTSARQAFLRASNYFRTAYVFLLAAPLDERAVRAYDRQAEAFARACALMEHPAQSVRIPFEETSLHGLFLRPSVTDTPRATLIVTGGYDGTAEENFFYSGAAALERGYNVLLYDGPGQGEALFKQGLHLRPDWENVLRPVVDFVLAQPGVASDQIALLGVSLGGYLAPRGASGEPRLAALVADPGQYSLLEEMRARLPGWLGRGLPKGNPLTRRVLSRMMERMMRSPTKGWALRRGLFVHGVATPWDYVQSIATYTLEGRAQEIACPTMVCKAQGDAIGASAESLFERLACTKRLALFKADDGAAAHCESGARALFNREMFDWLDTVLAR